MDKGIKKTYTYKYWRPAVAADNVVFRFDGKNMQILLVKRKNEPFKDRWAFPGGFMEEGETLEQAALRELMEETGIAPVFIRELCSQSAPDRDPRGQIISIVFYSFAKDAEPVADDDAAETRWFDIYDLPELAFDHQEIFNKALDKLRLTIRFDPSFFYLLDNEFTLPELHRLWSSVFNTNFDRRNFQKRWTSFALMTNVIEPIPPKNGTKVSARTPRYYKYNEDSYLRYKKKNKFRF